MSKKSLLNLKKLKKEHIFLIIILIVAIFFLFNSFKSFSFTKKEEKNLSLTEEYIDNIENKLNCVISKIKGVKSVTVKVNISSSYKNVYLTERVEESENGKVVVKEQPVIIGGKTILVQEEIPKISGVIVVAGGSDNIMVKTNILNTCVTFLGIDSNKIIILNGKN